MKSGLRTATTSRIPWSHPPLKTLRVLTVPEAAHYAKVSTQTIRRAIKAGHLKSYRAGRQIRIDESDLIEYLSL